MHRFHLPYLVVIHVLFGVSFGMNLWRGECSEAGRNVKTDWENADTLLGNVDEEAFKELDEILTPLKNDWKNADTLLENVDTEAFQKLDRILTPEVPLKPPQKFLPCERITLKATDQEEVENFMKEIKPYLWSRGDEAKPSRFRKKFGNLPAYETEVYIDGKQRRETQRVIGFEVPMNHAPLIAYDRRVEEAYERLIKWVVFYNAALLHSEEKSEPVSLKKSFMRWIKNQLFEPLGSEPTTGKRKNPDRLTCLPEEFGELQQMTLNCLAKTLKAEDDPSFQQTACTLVGIYYIKDRPGIIEFRSEDDFWGRIRRAGVAYTNKLKHGN